jgi:hypothetical protein
MLCKDLSRFVFKVHSLRVGLYQRPTKIWIETSTMKPAVSLHAGGLASAGPTDAFA